jgi:uncharacterized protein YndB with AHSA1/START domain
MTSPTPTPAAGLTLTRHGDREFRVERVFPASVERVWRALTEPDLVAQWWGRGNQLDIERMEVEPGGHWRYVEHAPDGRHGFEGRYREVTRPTRLAYTFDWDGMPGHVSLETIVLEDLGDGRTRMTTTSQYHTPGDRDGMLGSDMEQGLAEGYAALDALLERLS